jgi:HAD superfamily phosphatase (TIGR01668 family)
MDELYRPAQNTASRYHFGKVPNYIAPGVMGIDYVKLRAQGIRHLVFDVDNTLVSFGEHKLDSGIRDFMIELQATRRFATIRLATNSPRNLKWLRDELGLHITQPRLWRFKPLPSFYGHILADIHDRPSAVAMIGDKLIQDIWGANSVGMTSILVQPLGVDNWLDRVLMFRRHERRLLRKYLPDHIEKWF